MAESGLGPGYPSIRRSPQMRGRETSSEMARTKPADGKELPTVPCLALRLYLRLKRSLDPKRGWKDALAVQLGD